MLQYDIYIELLDKFYSYTFIDDFHCSYSFKGSDFFTSLNQCAVGNVIQNEKKNLRREILNYSQLNTFKLLDISR